MSDNAAINGPAASKRIRGVLAPIVTPFKDDLSPDSQRFIAHCKWLLSQNCGLAVFGTNSEANSLSMEQRFDTTRADVQKRRDCRVLKRFATSASRSKNLRRLRKS